MTDDAHFGLGLFQLLAELRLNNDREWFQRNKARFESEVREPLLEFIEDFAEPLRKISPHFVADPRPSGGSMFRIYRDVRFSKDKSPYKTQAAAHFRHERAKDVHAPGFYLHLEPGSVFAGTGMWHPDSASLGKIRDSIVANPARWVKATSDKKFAAIHRFEGESLSRPPKGYDKEHPLIEDLKRKDFVTVAEFTEDEVCSPGFIDRFAETCQAAGPVVRFLTNAVGLRY